MNDNNRTIRPAGETEAGPAGTQPARDSRPGLRQPVESGTHRPQSPWVPSPLAAGWRSSPMPQKIHSSNTKDRPAVGRINCLAELDARPIQAEPVQCLAAAPTVVQADRTRLLLMCDAAQVAGHQRKDADETRRCRQHGRCQPENSRKCKICDTYGDILRSCSAIDYDDQILLACRILRETPRIAENRQGRTRHLLVDEYQDINAGQFELIGILSHGQEE